MRKKEFCEYMAKKFIIGRKKLSLLWKLTFFIKRIGLDDIYIFGDSVMPEYQ